MLELETYTQRAFFKNFAGMRSFFLESDRQMKQKGQPG